MLIPRGQQEVKGPEKCAGLGFLKGSGILYTCTTQTKQIKVVGAPTGVLAGACNLWGLGVRVQFALPLGSFG